MDQKQPKSNVTTVIVIVVVILFVLGVGGFFVSRYFVNRALNSVVGNISKSPAKSTEEGYMPTATWPSDLTMGVPKYPGGTIRSVIKLPSPKTWDILIDNTTQTEYQNYLTAVKAAGWAPQGDTSFIVDISQYKKDNWDLAVAFDATSNGVKITVTEVVK